MIPNQRFPDIRDGVRALCRDSPNEYFRKVDAERAYPEAFVTGELRLQSMGVTEPTTGTDTTNLKTVAVRRGDRCDYDVERKFRETRLYQVAPISTNLIFSYVAEHVLGLPRSF